MTNILLTCIVALLLAFAAAAEESSPDQRLLAACLSPRDDESSAIAQAAKDGANINVKDPRSGQTCLMAATLRGKINVIRQVLKLGADVTIPEKDGYTPPHGAGFQGRPDIMRLLKEEANVDVINAPHPDGYFPFHRACWGREKRHAETVKYLLEIGEDVNRKGAGNQPQTCAEMTKNHYTLAILKAHGADGLPDHQEF
ncbi:repeat domain-containing protein 55 [Seminavis robusta]|uniref:Repeat domain-containing protein 55 n=1 Tax=Seminavis robusta TaxID=568900 RepID=A0A9N8HUT1_9STRA|nr:repeat domain-containing protein 55 [Seminavis robusta]|eukprot:Sro1805_g298770.1 repeat domain-containing protein 55 (199) ;mRNA; r:6579-7310